VKTKHFLNKLEHEQIHRAVVEAEHGTDGNIVVFITHKSAPDALAAAREVLGRRHRKNLAGDKTLLLFLAPQSQTFAAVGGKTLHDRVGQVWWDELVKQLGQHFRDGNFTDGLLTAIRRAGHALREHFPAAGETDRTGQHDIVEE
jgi:uncharacterized membrane protein